MISRKHRFHGYGSLNYVYKHGQIARGPLFSVKTLINPKRSSYRAAVVVSRKVNKSAVARNRMRRRLYGAIAELEANLTNADIVISVFNDTVLTEPPATLLAQLKKQLALTGCLKSPSSS